MNLPCIITTDIHLTANDRDSYRWGLFPWLEQQCKKHKAKSVLILGDITDAKDSHSAVLVNKVVTSIRSLSEYVEDVYILMGNHDYLKDGNPYFEFLSEFEGVHYISKPYVDHAGVSALYLPHTKNIVEDWKSYDFSKYEYVFIHQTINGSLASNGQKMEGELDSFEKVPKGKIYAGDIHVPQIIGPLEYVGSPYHVHFGDKFTPRVLLLDKDGWPSDLHFKTLSRVTTVIKSVEDLERMDFKEGDQIKVRVELTQASKPEWDRISKEVTAYCKEVGVALHAIECVVPKHRKVLLTETLLASLASGNPASVIKTFAEREALGGDLFDVGLDILEST